jgi:hypothetical protein
MTPALACQTMFDPEILAKLSFVVTLVVMGVVDVVLMSD